MKNRAVLSHLLFAVAGFAAGFFTVLYYFSSEGAVTRERLAMLDQALDHYEVAYNTLPSAGTRLWEKFEHLEVAIPDAQVDGDLLITPGWAQSGKELVDEWGTPLRLERPNGYRIVRSAGRDRVYDTKDDLYHMTGPEVLPK